MRVKIASIIIVSLLVVFGLGADSPQKAPSRLASCGLVAIIITGEELPNLTGQKVPG
jgi:hypothetical protein